MLFYSRRSSLSEALQYYRIMQILMQSYFVLAIALSFQSSMPAALLNKHKGLIARVAAGAGLCYAGYKLYVKYQKQGTANLADAIVHDNEKAIQYWLSQLTPATVNKHSYPSDHALWMPNLLGCYKERVCYTSDFVPGITALQAAVSKKREDLVKVLLENNAGTNGYEEWGGLNLINSVDTPKIFELLVRHGADPECVDTRCYRQAKPNDPLFIGRDYFAEIPFLLIMVRESRKQQVLALLHAGTGTDTTCAKIAIAKQCMQYSDDIQKKQRINNDEQFLREATSLVNAVHLAPLGTLKKNGREVFPSGVRAHIARYLTVHDTLNFKNAVHVKK